MVSVIIPVYNRESTIKKAITSVLDQTWSDLEVIVIDDGSTDNSANKIRSIQDTRVKYIYQENAGACAARNHGLDLAKGDIIAFHDSDDIWHLDKLEKQMMIFEKYDPDIVFCKLNQIRTDGTVIRLPLKIKEGFLRPIENLFEIGTQTIVAKRQVFDSMYFDKDMPRLQEFELLYRASKNYSIYCVDEGLVDYYVGLDSISSNPYKLMKACKIILEKHPEIKKDYPKMVDAMAHNLLNAAMAMKEQEREEWLTLVKFAIQCKLNLKIVIKSILIVVNGYNLWKKFKFAIQSQWRK